jgi:hypothetical protein
MGEDSLLDMLALCDIECSGEVYEECWSDFDCDFDNSNVSEACEPYSLCVLDACVGCNASSSALQETCDLDLQNLDMNDMSGLMQKVCAEDCLTEIGALQTTCSGVLAAYLPMAYDSLAQTCSSQEEGQVDPEDDVVDVVEQAIESFQAEVTITGFSHAYYEDNKDEVEAELKSDLSSILGGIDEALITINSVTSGSLIVDFSVEDDGEDGEVDLDDVYTDFTRDLQEENFAFPALVAIAEAAPEALEGSSIGVDYDRSNIELPRRRDPDDDEEDEEPIFNGTTLLAPSVVAVSMAFVVATLALLG